MIRAWIVLVILGSSEIASGQKRVDLTSLEWLIGKWEGKSGKAFLYENWERKNRMTMFGWGITVVKEDTVVQEDLQIHIMGQHLGYIASPNGASPTFFTLVESGDDKWIFENKEHDFPQRITYHQMSDNAFEATISGTNKNGDETKQTFSFTRIK